MSIFILFFFFNDTATTEIYTLSLHDALPIWLILWSSASGADWPQWQGPDRNAISKESGLLKEWPKDGPPLAWKDRKSTRLNSSHSQISYAVFCLKKKKKTNSDDRQYYVCPNR